VSDTVPKNVIAELTAQIVSAQVANNVVQPEELPGLILRVHRALAGAGGATAAKLTPAVPVNRSVLPNYIVCLEDGKQFKTLKRHLMNTYQLTPAQYRQRWGLPNSYPMVAPNYVKTRSAIAKRLGLGRKPTAAGRKQQGRRGGG
jgi:predicted transcriptional regulator